MSTYEPIAVISAPNNALGLELNGPVHVVQPEHTELQPVLAGQGNTANAMPPPEHQPYDNEVTGISFTVVPSEEEGATLREIAMALVSTQPDRIYLRIRQCYIPSLILMIKFICRAQESNSPAVHPRARRQH